MTNTLDSYPYHVAKVDSNDTLYAQDPEFLKEIQTYCDIIFQELLDNFKRNQNEVCILKLTFEFISNYFCLGFQTTMQ